MRHRTRAHGHSTRSAAAGVAGMAAPTPPSRYSVQVMEDYDYLVGVDDRFKVLKEIGFSASSIREYLDQFHGYDKYLATLAVLRDLEDKLTAAPRRGIV